MAKQNQKNLANRKFTFRMQKKLAVLFTVILVAFAFLVFRLAVINRDNGEAYKRQVLSQQSYDSIAIPAKRGEIVDRNGSKIAVSQKVYNVVIDCKTLSKNNGEKIEPTLNILYSSPIEFTYSRDELRTFIAENPSSQYRVIAKKQSFDSVADIMNRINNEVDGQKLEGVWLEDTYQRQYPYSTLACDVIGFVQGDNEGAYGLEEYYNDILVGVPGREYGYLNDDENLERTLKAAEDGKTLVTSLDMNIQSIVEKHILAFNEEHRGEYRPDDDGATNIGVIIMNPNNGEVMAMASSPVFDLNNPRDTSDLKVEVDLDPTQFGLMPAADAAAEDGAEADGTTAEGAAAQGVTTIGGNARDAADDMPSGDAAELENAEGDSASGEGNFINFAFSPDNAANSGKSYAEAYEEAYEKAKTEALNSRWKNFCINSTYEPGSTMKPFTMATGLEEGILNGDESYRCNGVMTVGEHEIHCNNRTGHGDLTFSGALEQSCNVAFMKMGSTIGKSTFMKYNQIFNFGLKTNIDLTGEVLTNSLVFDVNTMTPTDLAISSFGQGFNVTMIQMITGFCSLINGGYYYQPHVVTKILDSAGTTLESVEPRILKQTISEETSEKIRQLCVNVVSEGTGKSARPAGYMIGGKTGTAEKYPRGTPNYVVSFMGFAPSENPELVIYVVIDEPNVPSQASAKYAAVLTKDILTEVLPYLNIFMTEEVTEKEAAELAEKQLDFSQGATSQEVVTMPGLVDENGNPVEQNGDSAEQNGNTVEQTDAESAITFVDENEAEPINEIQYDPETGYAIDPTTGILLDPETGAPIDPTVSNIGF